MAALSHGYGRMSAVSRETQGAVLCLISACAFGALAIFAKLAYGHGADVGSLLLARFVIAGAVLWLVVAVMGRGAPSRATLLSGVALGAGYACQAGLYFSALEHIDASLTALLLYTYPALVFLGGLALGRERATRIKVVALSLSAAGTALVLAGGASGALNATGVALGLGSGVAYTLYILLADRAIGDAEPFGLTATIVTTAAGILLVHQLASGGLDVTFDGAGWAGVVGVALVSTVVAASTFMLGLGRVGASTASIVSTLEPVVTVGLAALFYAERLSALQLCGGVLVLSAVVVLQLRAGRVGARAAPDHAAPAPTARPAEEGAA
jgi:drug/metabolite transporter (DMT)-like permease